MQLKRNIQIALRWRTALTGSALLMMANPVLAQLALPDLPTGAKQAIDGAVDHTLTGVERALAPLGVPLEANISGANDLASVRISRLERFVRRYRETVEFDITGNPARKGELLLIDSTPDDQTHLEASGFVRLGIERLDTLNINIIRFGVPQNLSLGAAQKLAAKLLPDATITTDTLLFRASVSNAPATNANKPLPFLRPIRTPVGIIDSGVGGGVAVEAARGFARGAPSASNHGTAVAYLLRRAGVQNIIVADIYGTDPAGGNALAMSRALDWLTARGIKVISISLAGPNNLLLARAIATAQKHGSLIIAAVGNDGPAAPPAYPASYPGVLAITGVDDHNRALIEAGRALHLDFAAPAANLRVLTAKGGAMRVRGTSFATPLAAARAAAALDATGNTTTALLRLNAEAIDLGWRGSDSVYGRGLICAVCRPR